uniref:DUF2194 domain-containing protein n=1 Tax=Roseivirga sp. TaxID=1964215 RepID=UPI0040489A03
MKNQITYLRILLMLLVLVFFVGCDSKKEDRPVNTMVRNASDPFVIYIVDPKHPLSPDYEKQVAKVFDYTKIPFKSETIEEFNKDPNLTENAHVILINGTEALNDIAVDHLIEFVASGGTLIFPSVNEDQRMGFLSGTLPNASFDYDLNAKGIHFVKNLLPGMADKSIYPLKRNIGLGKDNFKPNINVFATSIEDKELPIIFENTIGNGSVIHFNTSISFEKSDRGLLFAAILRGLEGIPYPIANVNAIFIDDFPGPLYDIPSEPIKSELGINQAQFVTDVWWPDMLDVAEEFGVKYSAYTIFNFNEIKAAPFLFNEWDLNKTTKDNKTQSSAQWLSKQVINNGFELAIHGYNHESLLKELWLRPEAIENAFKAARKKWTVSGFGKFPVSYVAPSNYIDSVGLVHLKIGMPEMKYMSTTYEGDFREGGDRDFDNDKYEPQLFDFPRVTSGYVFREKKQYVHQSLYLYSGIWSHFIHPDDVFQLPNENNTSVGDFEYRNEESLGWHSSSGGRKGMLEYWREYLNQVKEIHPSARFLTVKDAAAITQDWRAAQYSFEATGEFVSSKMVSKRPLKVNEYYWFMFAKEEHADEMESELKKVSKTFTKTRFFEGMLFTIKTSIPELTFDKSAQFKSNSLFTTEEAISYAKEEYVAFNLLRAEGIRQENTPYVEIVRPPKLDNSADSVAYFVANESLEEATDVLSKRLIKGDDVDSTEFEQYVQFMGYQDKGLEVWELLEELYQSKSKDLAIRYLDLYLQSESYPSEELTERWLWRKIQKNPKDQTSVTSYLTYFYSVEYQERIKSIFEGAYERESSELNYAQYIQYLIDFEPAELLKELEEVEPKKHPLLWPKAATITYAFSDNDQIQQALTWADYSPEIPIITKLQWWVSLEAYNKMQDVYEVHHAEYPTDFETTAFVSNVWYDLGEYERAALLANELPENKDKEEFKARFNPDVVYFNPDVQKYLLLNTPDLFDPKTKNKIEGDLRYTENNSVDFTTTYVEDNFNQSAWQTAISVNLRNDSLQQHSVAATYASVSSLVLTDFDPANVAHDLYGIQYRFQTAQRPGKSLFSVALGAEQDNFGKNFINFQSSLSRSTEKVFKSLSLDFASVKTGPAISKGIYRSELVGYYERGSTQFLQTNLAVVGSYYTNGGIEGALTGRLFANLKRENKGFFSPFAEVFVSASNKNQPNGNPYWIIDSRFYGGGGMAWTYGRDERKLKARLEAAYFYDSYTSSFLRVSGNLSFPIREFTYVSTQFELFNQSLYYSNGLQFGVKHYFDRRRQYAYKPRPY